MKREGKPQGWTRRVLHFVIPALVIGLPFYFFRSGPESSPSAVRPWATAGFSKITAPTPSTGSPLDPQYRIKITRMDERLPSPEQETRRPRRVPLQNPGVEEMNLDFTVPSEEFVRTIPIHEFNAKDGFSSGEKQVRVKWMAGQRTETLPKPQPRKEIVSFHDASGKVLESGDALTQAEAEYQKRQNPMGGREMDVSFFMGFEAGGFQNPSWHLKGIFDARTQVSLLHRGFLHPLDEGGMLLEGILTTLHGASVLVVVDVLHGEEEQFQLLPRKGATVETPDLRVEVLQAAGWPAAVRQPGVTTHSRSHFYRWDMTTDFGSSVILDGGPNAVWDTLSFDAVDSEGKAVPAAPYPQHFHAPTPVRMVQLPVPLSRLQSIKVRRKPLIDRFIVRIDSLPGVTPGNKSPANLFEVQAPRMTFDDPSEMQYFIANTVQFKIVGGSKGYFRKPGFPMVIENATPRNVLTRYLSLPGERIANIDKRQMTIEFDDNMSSKRIEKAINAAKRLLRIP